MILFLLLAHRAYTADESSLTASAPETADVVVVGGGVIGCATLYHLAKLGVTNAVLVEKDQLTAGTTWHTAGESPLLLITVYQSLNPTIYLA